MFRINSCEWICHTTQAKRCKTLFMTWHKHIREWSAELANERTFNGAVYENFNFPRLRNTFSGVFTAGFGFKSGDSESFMRFSLLFCVISNRESLMTRRDYMKTSTASISLARNKSQSRWKKMFYNLIYINNDLEPFNHILISSLSSDVCGAAAQNSERSFNPKASTLFAHSVT